jgi:hypothetical protein
VCICVCVQSDLFSRFARIVLICDFCLGVVKIKSSSTFESLPVWEINLMVTWVCLYVSMFAYVWEIICDGVLQTALNESRTERLYSLFYSKHSFGIFRRGFANIFLYSPHKTQIIHMWHSPIYVDHISYPSVLVHFFVANNTILQMV